MPAIDWGEIARTYGPAAVALVVILVAGARGLFFFRPAYDEIITAKDALAAAEGKRADRAEDRALRAEAMVTAQNETFRRALDLIEREKDLLERLVDAKR